MPAPAEITWKCNPWARQLYEATERYIVLHSGRAAGKDYAVCQWVVYRMVQEVPVKVMFIRQFMSSIAQSIKALFEAVIHDMGVSDFFSIGRHEIQSFNGSLAHFRGADRDEQGIKGWDGYDILVANECQTISSAVWEVIKPTIRKEGSQIVCILNPRYPSDAIASELLGPDLKGFNREDVRIISLSYDDNRYLSDTVRAEIAQAKRGDPILFAHIWGGGYDIGSLANPFSRQAILKSRRIVTTGKPVFTAIDIALTESLTADYTVAIKGDKNGNLVGFQRFQEADYDIQVRRLMEYAKGTRVLVDATGVGHTVAQMMRKAYQRVTPIKWSLPLKREMIGSLAGLLDDSRIAIPAAPEWDWLQEELLHYERKETAAGVPTQQYGAAEGFHDDGVSALIMYAHRLIRPVFDAGVIRDESDKQNIPCNW